MQTSTKYTKTRLEISTCQYIKEKNRKRKEPADKKPEFGRQQHNWTEWTCNKQTQTDNYDKLSVKSI